MATPLQLVGKRTALSKCRSPFAVVEMIAIDSDPKDRDFADQTKTGDAAKVTSGANPGPPQNLSPKAAVPVASDAARPHDAETQFEATALPESAGAESV